MSFADIAEGIQSVLDVRLFELGGTTVTVASVTTFVILVIATFWFSRLFQAVVGRTLARGGLSNRGTIAVVQRALHYLILVAGVAVALQMIGISLATVFAAGAVVAVGVGFALQNILQNFVSGVILLAERTITERDVLEVGGDVLRVHKIGTRSTVARTRDDEELIIPNAMLVQERVKNYTLTDSWYRVRTRVGVAYGSDMRQVEETLQAAANESPDRLRERDPVVFMADFGDSSVVWEVSIWVADPWDANRIRSELNKAIWWALKSAEITIAFPQLDVHVQTPVGGRG